MTTVRFDSNPNLASTCRRYSITIDCGGASLISRRVGRPRGLLSSPVIIASPSTDDDPVEISFDRPRGGRNLRGRSDTIYSRDDCTTETTIYDLRTRQMRPTGNVDFHPVAAPVPQSRRVYHAPTCV